MAVPDITNLTPEELTQLVADAQAKYAQDQADAAQDRSDRQTAITAAISTLTGVLGPVGAAPGVDSIRAVRGYDAATMGANAGVALDLAFQGLEILTQTMLDIAHVTGEKP